jgi:rhodanese-related sulfurtransferase
MSRIDQVLDAARARLRRLAADEVPAALDRGALLVDIRPQGQRTREGEVPEALKAVVIERNVLEWRCDPTSEARLPEAISDDVQWVILCSEGYTSSLAAAALQDLGLHRATDVIGGYHALAAAGVLAGRWPVSAAAPGAPPATGVSITPPVIGVTRLRGGRRWCRWRWRNGGWIRRQRRRKHIRRAAETGRRIRRNAHSGGGYTDKHPRHRDLRDAAAGAG